MLKEEPLCLIDALKKVISGEWKIAKNIKKDSYIGNYFELSDIFKLADNFTIRGDEIGRIDLEYSTSPIFFSTDFNFFRDENHSNNRLWVQYDSKEIFVLDPLECLAIVARDPSIKFSYIDSFGNTKIISQETISSEGLDNKALKYRWNVCK